MQKFLVGFLKCREDQILLAVKKTIDIRHVDTAFGTDPIGGGVFETVFGDDIDGGFQQPFAAIFG